MLHTNIITRTDLLNKIKFGAVTVVFRKDVFVPEMKSIRRVTLAHLHMPENAIADLMYVHSKEKHPANILKVWEMVSQSFIDIDLYNVVEAIYEDEFGRPHYVYIDGDLEGTVEVG